MTPRRTLTYILISVAIFAGLMSEATAYTGLYDGLIEYWSFDDATVTGTQVVGYVNALNGSLTGVATGEVLVQGQSFEWGGGDCLDMNASWLYWNISDTGAPADFSISFWINTTGTASEGGLGTGDVMWELREDGLNNDWTTTLDDIDCATRWSTPLPQSQREEYAQLGYQVNRYCCRTRDRKECTHRSTYPTPEFCNLSYHIRDLK